VLRLCVNFSHDVPVDVQHENTATVDMLCSVLRTGIGAGTIRQPSGFSRTGVPAGIAVAKHRQVEGDAYH